MACPTETLTGGVAANGYTELVFFYNPKSKDADGNTASIEQAKRIAGEQGLAMATRETSPDPAETNAMVAELIRSEQTMQAVRAGDGAISELLGAEIRQGLRPLTLVMPGGNKNDGAQQIYRNNSDIFDHPEDLLSADHAAVQHWHPLHIRRCADDKPAEDDFGFVYFSVGPSARTARFVNQENYRNSPLHNVPFGTSVKEHLAAGKALLTSRSFHLEPEDSEPHRDFELIVANGEQMAGGTLKFAAQLLVAEAVVIEIPNRINAVSTLGKLVLGHKAGMPLDGELAFTLHASSKRPIYTQSDGQDRLHREPVRHLVTISERFIPVLTPYLKE